MGRGQKAQRAGKSSAVKGCVTPHLGSTPLHVRALAPPHLPPRKDPRRALLWALLHFTLYLVPFHSRPFYRHCVLDSGPTLTVYSKVSTWKACSCRGRCLCWWPFDMLGVTAAVGFTLQTFWGSHVCFPILVFCLFVCFLPWPIFTFWPFLTDVNVWKEDKCVLPQGIIVDKPSGASHPMHPTVPPKPLQSLKPRCPAVYAPETGQYLWFSHVVVFLNKKVT